MTTRTQRSPLVTRHLTLRLFAVSVLTIFAAWPHSAGAVTAPRAAGPAVPAACHNLPVSSQLITPTNCKPLGEGVAAAGIVPNTPDGAIALLSDERRTVMSFSGSGEVTLTQVSPATVCITASGHSTGIDVARGGATPGAISACHADGALVAANTSDRSGAQAAPGVQPHAVAPQAAGTSPPAASYSYYVASSFIPKCNAQQTSTCPLWLMGADTSIPTGGAMVILDFGAPCFDPSTHVYGVQTFFQQVCYSPAALQPLFKRWIAGFEYTHGYDTPATIIAAGLSNSVNAVNASPLNAAQMTAAGDAWARGMVNGTSVAGLAAPLTVWGGIDAEQSGGGDWLGPVPTRAFVDGFGVAAGHGTGSYPCTSATTGMLADFGDGIYLQGHWGPPGGWTVNDIYHVAWGASVACTVPEIYYDINAREWDSISDWAVSQGYKAITFVGPMSENGIDGTETAAQSWNSLQAWTGQSAPYVTNIAWNLTVTPGQLNALPATQSTTAFVVSWQVANGIGGATYTLWSQDGAEPWLPWLTTNRSTATFYGVAGHHYDFFIQTVGSGYANGGPGSTEANTSVAPDATHSEPFIATYGIDGTGVLRPGNSPPLATAATWPGSMIVRAIAVDGDGLGGQVVDIFGGLHHFGAAPNLQPGPNSYWNWDAARGIAVLPAGTGGYVLDAFGAVHAFGTAPVLKSRDYWSGRDLARGIVLLPSGAGGYVLDAFGGVHPFGTAPSIAVKSGSYWPNWDITRGITLNAAGTGGYVLDGLGGIHEFGTAPAVVPGAYWNDWDIARGIVLIPGSPNQGYVIDGWGNYHAFGGAPDIATYTTTPGKDIVRGVASA